MALYLIWCGVVLNAPGLGLQEQEAKEICERKKKKKIHAACACAWANPDPNPASDKLHLSFTASQIHRFTDSATTY